MVNKSKFQIGLVFLFLSTVILSGCIPSPEIPPLDCFDCYNQCTSKADDLCEGTHDEWSECVDSCIDLMCKDCADDWATK